MCHNLCVYTAALTSSVSRVSDVTSGVTMTTIGYGESARLMLRMSTRVMSICFGMPPKCSGAKLIDL